MGRANKWGEILANQAKALGSRAKRQKKADNAAFDIFPEWFTSAVSESALDKDKATSKEKDGYTTGVDSYLADKKAHRKITPTTYNKEQYKVHSLFSSPDVDQSINEPTNMGEFPELEGGSVAYNDPVISTKPTPTSKRLGVARPGPSTFIQTARYNPLTKQLNIQYTDGKVFPYHDVSPELADKILKKKSYHSPGQTLLNTIFYGHGTTRGDEIADIEEGM